MQCYRYVFADFLAVKADISVFFGDSGSQNAQEDARRAGHDSRRCFGVLN